MCLDAEWVFGMKVWEDMVLILFYFFNMLQIWTNSKQELKYNFLLAHVYPHKTGLPVCSLMETPTPHKEMWKQLWTSSTSIQPKFL